MSRLRVALFLALILSAWAAMHLYVLARANSIPAVAALHPAPALAAAALGLSWILARALNGRAPAPLVLALEAVGSTWMGVLFYATTATLAVDLATGFGLLLTGHAPALRLGALAGGALLAAAAAIQAARPPEVATHEVELPGLPSSADGTVVAVLSDLHAGRLLGRRWLSARAAQVRALAPDLVVFAGDLVDDDARAVRPLLPALREFRAPLGVLAVTGNHEYYGGADASVALMEEAGFRVLRGAWTEVRPGLVVAGIDDITGRRRARGEGDPVARATEGRPPGALVLLSHTPLPRGAAAASGAGLVLSGHTHGGQVWPFGWIVRVLYPMLEGRHRAGGTVVLVCRGTGTWGPRMRLWRRGEILRVVLRAPAAG